LSQAGRHGIRHTKIGKDQTLDHHRGQGDVAIMDFRFTPEQEALKKESEDFFRDETGKVHRLGGGYSVYASDAEKMQAKSHLGGS